MKITTTQNVELTPKDLAEMFCNLNYYEQAEFLDEVANTFHSWGDDTEKQQAEWIMKEVRYGKLWIELLMENGNDN